VLGNVVAALSGAMRTLNPQHCELALDVANRALGWDMALFLQLSRRA